MARSEPERFDKMSDWIEVKLDCQSFRRAYDKIILKRYRNALKRGDHESARWCMRERTRIIERELKEEPVLKKRRRR